MLQVSVQNGTRAGRKKPFVSNPTDYTCPVREGGCGKVVRYYWVNCPNCGHPRPDR